MTDLLTGKGTFEQSDWAWEEMFAYVKAAQTPIQNPLLSTYWTMAAVRHGEYVAKVRVAPDADNAAHALHPDLDINSGPDVYGPVLSSELRVRDFAFELQVQLCRDLETMPVNDSTVEWPEKLSPFVTVGSVRLPRQDISSHQDFERTDALAFNQWRVTADHRPLGEIMQVRSIYSASAEVRRMMNHQPPTEPTSADEVLSLPRLDGDTRRQAPGEHDPSGSSRRAGSVTNAPRSFWYDDVAANCHPAAVVGDRRRQPATAGGRGVAAGRHRALGMGHVIGRPRHRPGPGVLRGSRPERVAPRRQRGRDVLLGHTVRHAIGVSVRYK